MLNRDGRRSCIPRHPMVLALDSGSARPSVAIVVWGRNATANDTNGTSTGAVRLIPIMRDSASFGGTPATPRGHTRTWMYSPVSIRKTLPQYPSDGSVRAAWPLMTTPTHPELQSGCKSCLSSSSTEHIHASGKSSSVSYSSSVPGFCRTHRGLGCPLDMFFALVTITMCRILLWS